MPLDFDDYDQRHYRTVDAREGYAVWSQFYDQQMNGLMDLDLLEQLDVLAPPISGRVADLACGTGRIGAWLASRGAGAIDGVDFSPEMIAHAESKGAYASLRREDIRETSLETSAYALVTNVLSSEHLPELEPVYAEAARIAGPGAHFVILCYHPHFMLNGIPTHFRDREGENTAITTHIHLISDHVAAARDSGWTLLDLRERVVDPQWVEDHPNWQRHAGKPVSFVAVWERA